MKPLLSSLALFGLPVAFACSGSAPQPPQGPAPDAVTMPSTVPSVEAASDNQGPAQDPGDEAGACDLYCEPVQLRASDAVSPDHSARAEASAARVIAELEDELLACYRARVVYKPQAHGFLTVDIVVAPDGHVTDVKTAGGALLGKKTLECLATQFRSAKFEPPYGGGTQTFQVPFSLRRVAPAQE